MTTNKKYFGWILVLWLAAALPVLAAKGDSRDSPRPEIGVVLGGGGALGMAHVGVLRVLEEMQIPLDCIGGTSMGAIISGMYASGMSPDEIEQFLKSQNWWDVLNDHTPRRDLEYRRKKDEARFFIEFGWRKGLRFGSGAASGQKFNNLLETETLRTVAITNFDELPIPFRCVATDLRTGKGVVLDHGNLAKAMRASMAVPGAFTPVEWDDYMFADGGLVNNMPVDVVRAMGADVLIAVDVGGSAARAETNNTYGSIGEVLSRTYSIMQRPEQEKNLATADIVLVPEISKFSASDFQKVEEIVRPGEAAARAAGDQLRKYGVDDEAFRKYLANQRRARPADVPIAAVALTGNQRVDARVARGRVRSRPGPLDLEQVRRDLLHLYGLGEFEQIRYSVRPGEDGRNTLEYAMKEKPWGPNYLHLGLRLKSDFDQDTDWGLLLNFRKTSLNRLGGEWDNDLEMGSNLRAFSEIYQPLTFSGVWFAAPSAEYVKTVQGIYSNHDRIADYDLTLLQLRIDAGIQLSRYAVLRAGPVWRNVDARVKTGATDLPEGEETEAGWTIRLGVDRLDRVVFPREGGQLHLTFESIEESMGSPESYERAWGWARQCFSQGDHTLEAGIVGGLDFDNDLPVYSEYLVGGENSFIGLTDGELRLQDFGIGSLTYRYRLARLPPTLGQAIYAILRFDAGKMWRQAEPEDEADWLYGAGAGLGLDTEMGPIYLGYGRTSEGDARAYFSLGTIF
jgi:NTE family protein